MEGNDSETYMYNKEIKEDWQHECGGIYDCSPRANPFSLDWIKSVEGKRHTIYLKYDIIYID